MARNLLFVSVALVGLTAPASAQVVVGVRVGGPYYRTYYPPPVVVVPAPPAVVVPAADPVLVPAPPPPAPVVVQTPLLPPAPVVVQPAPVVYSPAPVVVSPDRHHHRHYHVQYRRTCREPWLEYAAFHFRERAGEAERVLARRGYEARIVFQ